MKRTLLFLAVIIPASLSAQVDCSDLFFSEYVEGSSQSKAIEIYNNITDNNKDLLIYRCNREKEKIQHNSKYLELYKKSVKIKDYGLSQELLYKVNIECCICMENTCNYLTRCYHTICLKCKDNIQGRCPICREPNWRI